eukprot:Selendium_serpulae@DN6444_c0_g1_i10.p2
MMADRIERLHLKTIDEVVPLEGRYEFPTDNPRATDSWMISKWVENLKLSLLQPKQYANFKQQNVDKTPQDCLEHFRQSGFTFKGETYTTLNTETESLNSFIRLAKIVIRKEECPTICQL